MKIPRSIKIGAHRIKIRVLKTIKGEMANTFGYANFSHYEIVLRSHYAGKPLLESVRAETLLHETIHHIANINAISLTEKEVQQLGTDLLEAIRTNKLDFLNTEE